MVSSRDIIGAGVGFLVAFTPIVASNIPAGFALLGGAVGAAAGYELMKYAPLPPPKA